MKFMEERKPIIISQEEEKQRLRLEEEKKLEEEGRGNEVKTKMIDLISNTKMHLYRIAI